MYKKYFLISEIKEVSISDLCTSIQTAIQKNVLERYGKFADIIWKKCFNRPLVEIDTWIPCIWEYVKII